MTANHEAWDEEQLASLFAAASEDGPPPDEEFLRRLRDQSTQVFTAAQPEHGPAPAPLLHAVADRPTAQSPTRRPKMMMYAVRLAYGALAASLAAVVCFLVPGPADSAATLAQAFTKVAEAKTVHLQVSRDGQATEAWAKRPGRLRWNLADGTYQVARGDRAWLVNEKANRAASRPAALFQGEGQALDPLSLLLAVDNLGQLDDKARAAALAAKPVQRQKQADGDYDLYQFKLKTSTSDLQIEALVSCRSGCLRSLEAKGQRDGQLVSLAAIKILKVDSPVPEDLFIVGATLTEDGRIGKVVDAQGICAVKPLTAERWTPLGEGVVLLPGDWVRTDRRGANAVALRLVKDTQVTLGPGALVELVSPKQIRVHSGDVKVVAAKDVPVEVSGPDKREVEVKGTYLGRVQGQRLAQLDKPPLWLKGFEGKAVGESLGSLVALIGGQNTPLSVGYHKVSVDIRDQIARTVIEESFVNHTDTRLEGVFHFPLPQDASISGFGMWIGNELVEADIVEKQRAREIFEIILREKRDPGLLEWTGGNIFKARVFPIEAHSEKRIKITYTQVLPLHTSSYRYSYALHSELLKQHPLRALAIDVTVQSAVPLRSVTCPTHLARTQQTAHAARVEFTAQDYTPDRDFEVVVETGHSAADVVLIPHRRGDDGYFMALVSSPAQPGSPMRDLLTGGEPLEVLILADTSASLDRAARASQAELVGTLLGSLTERDRVNLAGCDVACDWVFDQAVPADQKNADTIRDFLAKRLSLGWTDLDKAFAAAFARCGPKTRIVYVGDGISTTGDADPASFAKRLKKLYAGKSAVCYAVSVGSSFETQALKAVAACGGGTVRQVSGERGPQTVACELLSEMTRPTLRDLKVEFRGLQVARVYPEELPSLPAGTQQIILGRYLPEGKDQAGEVVVTGTLDGKPVRYASPVSLKDAEQGNSFIPRLWARQHLDFLLQQGSTQTIQDEVVALSEEYHIMTPYTSLLVLETDADRERFKVKRRFLMRDGEKFFAKGRDQAKYDLVQQQMRKAGQWRLGLRRSVLAQLAGLGRDPALFQRIETRLGLLNCAPTGRPFSAHRSLGESDTLGSVDGCMPTGFTTYGGAPSGMGGSGSLHYLADAEGSEKSIDSLGDDINGRFDQADKDGEPRDEEVAQRKKLEEAVDAPAEAAPESLSDLAAASATPMPGLSPMSESLERYSREDRRGIYYDYTNGPRWSSTLHGWQKQNAPFAGGYYGVDLYQRGSGYDNWLGSLFPSLTAAPGKVPEFKPRKPWPNEARAIAQSLLRTDVLAKLQGGLRLERQHDYYEARFARLTARSAQLALVSPGQWLTRGESDSGQTIINWCDAKERGILAQAHQLGRVRAAKSADLAVRAMGLDLDTYMLARLDHAYDGADVELKPQGEGRVLLRLTYPESRETETRFLIDTARHVILSMEVVQGSKVTSSTKYDGFVEVAGAWWPGRVETFDAKGRRTTLTTLQLTALTAAELAAQVKQQLAGRELVQLLREPLPKLVEAKRALAGGQADFASRIVLMDHFARSQQWTQVLDHLAGAEKLAPGKPGLRWLRNAALSRSRQREELQKRLLAKAAQLARAPAIADTLFLANHVLNTAAGILEANETLRLLDVLQPVYERQPAFTRALKGLSQQRVNYLQQTSQPQEAMKLLRQLAADHPEDYSLQQQYAQSLAQAGERAAAFRLLRAALDGKTEWLSYEQDSLLNTYCQLMQGQGRWAELADYLKEWLKREPESTAPYEQYFSALVRLDKLGEANTLAGRWLDEARKPGKLAPAAVARLQAAVDFLLGNISGVSLERLLEQWLPPLADTALFFARHESQGHIAERIMGNWRFTRTDEYRRVCRESLNILRQNVATLKPAEVQRLLGWGLNSDSTVLDKVEWRKLAAELRRRWDAEKDPHVKHQLAAPLAQVLSSRLGTDDWLAFLRVQMKTGPQEYRAHYTRQLFDALLNQPWVQATEDEALALLDKLTEAKDSAERLAVQVPALYQLTDRLVIARQQAKMRALEHPEKLNRLELRAKEAEFRQAGRTGLADRLARAAAQGQGPLVPWLNAERLYLDVLANRNLDKVAEECWKAVGPVEKKADDQDNPLAFFDAALQARHLTTLVNLAARKAAPAGTAERLLQRLDARIAAADKDDLSGQLDKYLLLVALDRPKELEQALRAWVKADGPVNRWRLALGYLLAEQGKLAEAIALFEQVRKADELGPLEYRTLAAWYLVMDRKADYEKAQIASYKVMDEWRLSNLIAQKLRPWQRHDGHVPAALDREVLLVFAALFEKSASPQGYLWQLQQLYRESRDFELLAGLADAVVGHTAGKAYPFVQGMGSVLNEVRDEATADSVVERLAEVRKRAKTDVDQRALDMLEVQVERRAAELLNQPGPHVAKALAALQRAFKRQWTAGEPRLMASYLAGLGRITQVKLADEQVRQLAELHRQAAKGTSDRLHIALCLANARWGYDQQQEAIDLLARELRAYQEASGGKLPLDANDALAALTSFFEARGHYAKGEQLLLEQLVHSLNAQQGRWLTQRLYQLYESALRADGEVSLGRGVALYQAVAAKVEADLAASEPDHRSSCLSRLCSLYRLARDKKLPGTADDARTFAFQRFPKVIQREQNNYSSMVSQVAQTLRDVYGPYDGLAFLLAEIEREPQWLRYCNQNGWSQHGGTMTVWRAETKNLGELAPRLLRVVLQELKQDLRLRESRHQSIYRKDYGYYWAEKEADFARVAEEVYAEKKGSGPAVAYIAEYLYRGLHHHDRGIEMLLTAQGQGILDESAQGQLVQYLHERSRHAESIAILKPLVERRPENVQYRVWLMHAYCRTGQQAPLLALLKDTDAYFHQGARWNEGVMAALAASTLENQLYEQSVKYYDEVIALHQRIMPNRGIGNGTLSEYYRSLARAHGGLKNTMAAVDAACGAIISWGSRHDHRAEALKTLRDVLQNSPNLEAYVAALDKKSAETGLHNPVVRKALGQVYLERKEYARATVQLQLAVELQPNDTETHQALLACYDALADKEGAFRQLLASLQLSRRDSKLYEDLGWRLTYLKREVEAERAFTSIVEMQAVEGESHAVLAEVRQKQDRWDEAIAEWRHVVRLRALEPTGLLKLAEAQIHQQHWEGAEDALRQLEKNTWPTRFNTVEQDIQNLRHKLEQARKGMKE